MAQKVQHDKRPYQREKYQFFKNSGQKINSKIKDGFSEYRDITTGEHAEPRPDLGNPQNLRQFTFDRRVIPILKNANDKLRALRGEKVATQDFVYFVVKQISNAGQDTIGRITEYTTEERLTSMIYRHYHKEHARPCSFTAKVLFSGDSPEEGKISASSRMPYVEIPTSVLIESDLEVDDEILITITNERGDSWTELYHVSNMGLYNLREEGQPTTEKTRRYIVPLVGFKRAVVLENIPEDVPIKQSVRFVTKHDYNLHTAQLKKGEPLTYSHSFKPRPSKANPKPPVQEVTIPCHRLINEYDTVTVQLVPQDYTIHNSLLWHGMDYRPIELTVNQIQDPGASVNCYTWNKEPLRIAPRELLDPPEDGIIKAEAIKSGAPIEIKASFVIRGRFDFAIETIKAYGLPGRD